jgi:predicted O-methyltransferase YrrM
MMLSSRRKHGIRATPWRRPTDDTSAGAGSEATHAQAEPSLVESTGERSNYPQNVAVAGPSQQTMEFIRTTDCRVVAEIGIYHGDTSREIAKWLNGRGELHLFDFHDRVEEVASELRAAGHNNVRTFPSSYKLLDSYNWPLAKLLKEHEEPIYDYVFIDGARTWAVDALTTLLVDRLLKVGGYLDFDDYYWTLAGSPSLNPETFPLTGRLYTEEQIATQQVKMICELLVRRDPRYEEIVPNKIFRKVWA